MKTAEKINVLLTCANAQISPSVFKLLKASDYVDKVVGIDANSYPGCLGKEFFDTFYKVPNGESPDYFQHIETIVKKEKIRVLFPASDEELFILSERREQLQSNYNCSVVSASKEVVNHVSNKAELCKQINLITENKVSFFEPKTLEDLEQALIKLGHPQKKVLLKPKFGRGSKGIKIICEERSEILNFEDKFNSFIKSADLLSFFKKNPDHLRDYLVSEYLTGEKYSSDILAKNGEIHHSIQRSNGINPKLNPPTQYAEIVNFHDIKEFNQKICKHFKIDNFAQIEVGRDSQDKLKIIEINARLDATLPITMGLGHNYYDYLIHKQLFGVFPEITDNWRSGTFFYRYWSDGFTTNESTK